MDGVVGRRLAVSGGVWLLAGAVVAVLVAFASGYGYHRDELYFLAAGHHLAWGYADQGVLTPLLARLMSNLSASSLTVLRLPSALAAGFTVILTGLLAREFGGGRRAQLIAAACSAVAVIVLFTGHLLSTSTFDLLDWAVVSWLVVRAVRTGEDWLLVAAGVVLGIGLENKPLPAFLAVGLLAAVAISGPRRLLASRGAWAGAALALLLWLPWIVWQASHGWPQIAVSKSLAAGHSTSSQPWWAVVPFQALLVSPPLAPIWVAGLVALFRDRGLREFRFLAWAWLLLAVVFMASGGKPYYLTGLLPALLGAGSVPTDRWLDRGRTRPRLTLLIGVIALSAAIDAVIALPILPTRDAGPVIALNKDVGETIGWPRFTQTVAGVYRQLPSRAHAVIFTANYGEAGAIDRYGPALGVPHAYSGQNAYWYWGPPPAGSQPVVTIGLSASELADEFRGCGTVAHVNNGIGINNEEQDEPISVCSGPLRPWSREWRSLRRLG